MNGKGCRDKGAAGEREFLKLLSDGLGIQLERNLSQSRSGGADCLSLGNLAIEVKRQETLNLSAWWSQAVLQANRVSGVPVLAYRQSRKPWSVAVPMFWLTSGQWDTSATAQLSLETFIELCRRRGIGNEQLPLQGRPRPTTYRGVSID